ncbi:hypothetical protein ACN27G_27630 [Plantactinospora sp. WMMB334]|uniref:hypothetical protein n=1 Tax=Plantactinospora sp. WMMB334 TaxID=3404119 RepID=UPI003B956C82
MNSSSDQAGAGQGAAFDRMADTFARWGLPRAVAESAAARPFDGNVTDARRVWSGPLREDGQATGGGDPMAAAVEAVTVAAQAVGMSPEAAGRYALRESQEYRRRYGHDGALRMMTATADALRRDAARRQLTELR